MENDLKTRMIFLRNGIRLDRNVIKPTDEKRKNEAASVYRRKIYHSSAVVWLYLNKLNNKVE